MAVLALPTLLLALDVSVLFMAMPHLSRDLGANGSQQLWIMDIYGFMVAGFLVTMGTLGDRIGRRRLMLIGAAAFGAASIAAAFAVNAEMLIVARALLGVAGATLMPATMALIGILFPDPRQRGTAMGVWMSCFLGGTALGPVIGGAMLELFWWGAAFLLGVPVMLLLLVAGPRLLPERRDPEAGAIDLVSVVLSLATVLPVVYGLKELARTGLTAHGVLAVPVGLGCGVAFIRRQKRLEHPLLDLRLFGNRTLRAGLLIGLLVGMTMGGTFLLISQYIQLVGDRSPVEAGLWLIPGSLAMAASSLLAPRLTRIAQPAYVLAGGLLLSACGLAVITFGGTTAMMTGFILAHAGLGPLALTYDLVLGSAPPEKAGAASALNETGGELGISLGIAALGSLATAIYRNQVPGSMPEPARESLADAVATGRPDVIQPAGEAFTTALHIVTLFGAGLFAALAFLTVALLRRRETTPAVPVIGQSEAMESAEAPTSDRTSPRVPAGMAA
jgi:DHA2 family multidrug resistance protein-like MFS transporter